MKSTKRFLAIILAIHMVISIIPLTASAETPTSGTCGDNLTWEYDSATYTLTISGTGTMYDYPHNKRPWESYEDNIKVIIINDGVTSIGRYAFAYFDNLQDVTISNSVLYIGEYAFCSCDNLTEIVIPKDVTTIVSGAFSGCDSLIGITVDSDNQYYSNDGYGVLYNKDKTILVQYPFGSTQKNYIIPDGVTTIGKNAFNYSPNLESVTIPESVTILENYVFRTNIYDLILYYKGTQAQWDELLANNSETSEYLKNYTVICTDNTTYPSGVCGDNLTWIFNKETNTLTISGTGDMYDYEINDVSGFINQPWYNFSRNIKHIVVEDGVTSIGEAAFTSCDATDITIGDSVASIGSEAIKYCDYLTEIIVDEDNQYYSNDEFGVLFNKDKTTLIYYPIGNQRENYTIPDGVKVIGTYAFDKCNKTLLKVTIPKSVTIIEKFAFNVTGFLAYYIVDYVGTQAEWSLVSVDGTNDMLVNCLESEHQHEYKIVVNAPTCTEQGYTTYTCECGDSYNDNYVDATGHHHKSEITIPATHLEEGLMTFICACGDTYTGKIEKLEKHNYEAVVTAPTCTEQGYTTYTCVCGDTYVDDYFNALGHTEEIVPAVAPTCTETGLTASAKCSVCGKTLTEQKELPANGHTPVTAIEENYVAPTCTETGSKDVVVYCSACNEELSRETETLETTGHADNDGDGYCDADNELLDPSVECDHACHKGGISRFIWKIINFFNKLLGLNKTCDCGVAHY